MRIRQRDWELIRFGALLERESINKEPRGLGVIGKAGALLCAYNRSLQALAEADKGGELTHQQYRRRADLEAEVPYVCAELGDGFDPILRGKWNALMLKLPRRPKEGTRRAVQVPN